jgi:mono/diheme cytochrome c family protein
LNTTIKRVLKGVGLAGVLVAATGAAWGGYQVAQFDASMDRIYDVPLPPIVRSTDPVVVARGKHIVESLAACATEHCNGTDLGGGTPVMLGPIGTLAAPNITMANLGAAYSDGELARVIKHGIKKDGRSLRFMPAQDTSWLPDSDVTAVVSYLRVAPPVERANQSTVIKPLGKVLDRRDQFVLDVARRIDHTKSASPPAPEPTAAYGVFVARLCSGCHGEHLSGGPIPGAPPSLPTPLNLTPDATGLKDWTFDDFEKVMRQAVRKNGKPLDPFMPVEAWRNFDDTEMHALWAYLRTVQPMPLGGR